MRLLLITLVTVVCCPTLSRAEGHDWPMWRYDAGRTAVTPHALAETLHLQWTRQLPAPAPAFRNERLRFDAGYEPVVMGKQLFVGSARTDSVTAYDTDTGEERWRFYADGPVRCAPVAANGRVYFGSDDGCVYCLDAEQGRVIWRVRAVPSNRTILGNGRLISVWPIRGGPVLVNGTLYFAAGVWPLEGTFIYALEAATGKVVWLNDRGGFVYGRQPHNAVAIGGISPQGYLFVNGDDLVVPCGTAYPATLDRHTGEIKSFELPSDGRLPGGWFASLDARRGKVAFDSSVNREQHEDKMNKGRGTDGVSRTISVGGRVLRFDDEYPGVHGRVHTMIAADGKLFVVSDTGRLYCFGESQVQPKSYTLPQRPLERADDKVIPQATSAQYGYALVSDSVTAELLAVRTELKVIAVGADDRQKRRWDDAGLYGTRITSIAADAELPPYFASLIVTEELGDLANSLRPFGGTACTPDGRTLSKRDGPLPGSTNYTTPWQPSPDDLVRAPLGVLWYDDTLGHFKRSPQPLFVDGVMISQPKDWTPAAVKPPYRLLPTTYSDVYTGRVLPSDDPLVDGRTFPAHDATIKQPNQYRPPSQKNDWKPDQPRPGRRTNPLTGVSEPRVFPKSYGCDGGFDYGHLYTMRSGTAAFYDKRFESGIVHISGPRSGCTNSIIPANGLLNVPYFYEGCTCSYPIPSALALVAMPPKYEQWAVWGNVKPAPVERVGINFGAPGDRMDPDGTLWLNYPSVGGPSPGLSVKYDGESFYRHSLWMKGGKAWPWVAASGVTGVSTITIAGLTAGTFKVRLIFAAPDTSPHRFDVSIQDRRLLESFDITAASADKIMHSVVHEFSPVESAGELKIVFQPLAGEPLICGIELIAQR